MPLSKNRRNLSRQRVLECALAMIEDQGAQATSMRRLASEVGVEAMSLYNHVANREDLLDGVIELLLSRLTVVKPSNDWQQDLMKFAEAYRDLVMRYPNTAAVMFARQVFSQSALLATGSLLEILARAGYLGEGAVRIARVILAFMIGSLMREVHANTAALNSSEHDFEHHKLLLEQSKHPLLIENSKSLAIPHSKTEYLLGLTLLLSAIAK